MQQLPNSLAKKLLYLKHLRLTEHKNLSYWTFVVAGGWIQITSVIPTFSLMPSSQKLKLNSERFPSTTYKYHKELQHSPLCRRFYQVLTVSTCMGLQCCIIRSGPSNSYLDGTTHLCKATQLCTVITSYITLAMSRCVILWPRAGKSRL